jgi:lipid II:glycine glycyltransferase (peptidoglycan interpeptide bridge formation enzyme)
MKNYLSSITGTFGGWISNQQLDIQHANLLVDFLSKRFSNLYVRMNPYNDLFSKVGLSDSQDDETHALNLNKGFEAVYKDWARGNKSSTKKAIKEGVSVRLASTLDDWSEYYKVYEDSLRRWADNASSRYEWELFKEIFQRKSNNTKLWLAVYQNQIISGTLCFYAKKHVVYWHGATLEDFFNLRPVNLLMYESVKDACEQGYSWFDFNPSGGHEGVKEFKKRFGTEALACPVLENKSPFLKTLNQVRSSFSRH